MRKKYSVILIAILALGCIQGTSSSKAGNAGIEIQNFGFSSADITDEQKASATFTVANVGSKTVSGNILVWFYGPIGVGPSSWTIEREGSIDISSGEATIGGETFYPPIPEKSIPGSSKKFDILMTPPVLPKGMKQSYEFFAEICYPYATTALAEIVSTSQNEFAVRETSSGLAPSQSTQGPIKVSLTSQKNIRTSSKVPLVFTVTDVGGGYAVPASSACVSDIDITERNKVDVTVLVDRSSSGLDCGTGGNTATVDIVNMRGLVFCTYEVPQVAVPARTYSISASADYNYYSRKTAQITLLSSLASADN